MARPLAPFRPLPWQIAPLNDRSPVMLLTGSAGGGKSRVAAEKIHAYCLKYPGATALILRKAREWNSRSVLPFFWHSVVGGEASGIVFRRSEGAFYYQNGSVVYTGGMLDERQREAIRSIGGEGGLDIVWMEEANAFTREDFEEVLGRLRHTAADWQQIILTTNPAGAKHWIKRDLIDGRQASVYYSSAADNPHNSPAYLERLNSLTGIMYQRLVLGRWVQAEGAVYDNFDRSIHVVERDESEMKEWYLALDEGYTNPAVILLVGQDADGRLHVAKEWYERGKLQETVVRQVVDWARQYNVTLVAVDAAAAGLIADIRNHGIPAIPSKGRVLDGIQIIQNRLAIAGDGRPRLTVSAICENTIAEFETYVWRQDRISGKPIDEPLKENDHAMDALRYLVIALGEVPAVEYGPVLWR